MTPRPKVCVFCGSSNSLSQGFVGMAELFGKLLADNGFDLIWGGCDLAAMGAVARGVQSKGGKATGIVLKTFVDGGIAYTKADELIVVPDLGERKKQMRDKSNAFVVLPGGIGTLDEFADVFGAQVVEMKSKGKPKPIVVVNWDKFYDPLVHLLESFYKTGVATEEYRKLYAVVDNPSHAIGILNKSLEKPS